MSVAMSGPTPYPDVNALLQRLLASVRETLRDDFVGMYLYGSLASGDFDPEGSDIDFMVVTARELPADPVRALEAMHADLTAEDLKRAPRLEGAYISQQALRRFDLDAAPCPTINERHFHLDRQSSDWVIQRHVLYECGVVVTGPSLRAMVDPVPPDDIRRAVYALLHSWWSLLLDDPSLRLQNSGYQGYAVFTMCRALYALEHGVIVSKPVAAHWAQRMLGEPWAGLIECAFVWRHGGRSERLNDVLAFIRYTIQRSDQFSIPTAVR
jgi:predicted nucleotidyltransferase